ncbi:MAG: efflux transporter outer membrane subunit [Rubrivivax sp.]
MRNTTSLSRHLGRTTRGLRAMPVRAARLAGVGLVLGWGLAGCTLGPDYQRPTVPVPAQFGSAPSAAVPPTAAAVPSSLLLAPSDALLRQPPQPAKAPTAVLDSAWWKALGDPALDQLVDTALRQNQDLRIAAARIQQFDAYLQISRADGGPRVDADLSRTRDTLSENRQVPLVVGAEPVDNSYIVGLRASWELDLWGKVARGNEAALAELAASEEARLALTQSLVSEVVAAYLRLLSLDQELALLRETLDSHRATVRLTQARFDGGGSSELPVVHALSELQHRLPELPAKEAEVAAQEFKLNLLLGNPPGAVARNAALAKLSLPGVPAGLPADLLRQRPDVRRAEQDLVAANARIGVAKAGYLPTISLTASNGFASNELSKLSMLTSNFGSFGVNLLGPLFNSGRTAGLVREAEALQQQAAETYVKAVQTAVVEVEDALVRHQKAGEQRALRELQIKTLVAQRELAQRRFDGGAAPYFDVLVAERGLLAGQQMLNQALREQATALVAIHKAMGGGWSLPVVTAQRVSPQKLEHD